MTRAFRHHRRPFAGRKHLGHCRAVDSLLELDVALPVVLPRAGELKLPEDAFQLRRIRPLDLSWIFAALVRPAGETPPRTLSPFPPQRIQMVERKNTKNLAVNTDTCQNDSKKKSQVVVENFPPPVAYWPIRRTVYLRPTYSWSLVLLARHGLERANQLSYYIGRGGSSKSLGFP